MSRPRIKGPTADLINELDQRFFELPAEQRPEALEKRVEGRGSGNNHFTQDSIIRAALEEMENSINALEAALKHE